MPIKFNYIKPVRVPHTLKLKRFLTGILNIENKKPGDINYIFCTDEYLLKINKEFLQHDYFTDIITFDLSQNDITNGEIYISIDRVKENAHAYKVTIKMELYRVMIHGILHLAGYKDKKKSEIQLMRSKEEHYLILLEKKINAVD